MTDKEKRDDAEIQDHLKKVYGFSEEQLLKELESAEKSVSDSDFPGAEERIFQKLMERKAEEEKKEIKEPEKKVVRFKKKNIFLAAAVASILALALGSTAIGEKNYFLRRTGDGVNYTIAIDNDKNKIDTSQLEAAYSQIEEELKIPVLKFFYMPEGMTFEQLKFEEDKAIIVLNYKEQIIYYFMKSKDKSTSISIKSDEQDKYEIYNPWLNKNFEIKKNNLSNGEEEYEAQIQIDENLYCLTGKIEKDEVEKIIKNLHFD